MVTGHRQLEPISKPMDTEWAPSHKCCDLFNRLSVSNGIVQKWVDYLVGVFGVNVSHGLDISTYNDSNPIGWYPNWYLGW